jgi:hypothetical protein
MTCLSACSCVLFFMSSYRSCSWPNDPFLRGYNLKLKTFVSLIFVSRDSILPGNLTLEKPLFARYY